MLPIELIQDEQEFKHSCATNGREAIRLLSWIAETLKKETFQTNTNDGQANILRRKVGNIAEFIQTIENAALVEPELHL